MNTLGHFLKSGSSNRNFFFIKSLKKQIVDVIEVRNDQHEEEMMYDCLPVNINMMSLILNQVFKPRQPLAKSPACPATQTPKLFKKKINQNQFSLNQWWKQSS
ncbi:hypothetical protein ABPG72_019356 [Tetrahymena utriculariae]